MDILRKENREHFQDFDTPEDVSMLVANVSTLAADVSTLVADD